MPFPLTKLEIDIQKNEQLREALDIAKKNHCPAIVVAPELVAAATIMRGVGGGKYQILTTVDWPKGDQLGRDKFRGMPTEAMNTDGYEVLLSARGSLSEIANEVKYISKFFAEYFSPLTELRFVLNLDQPTRNKAQVESMLEACKKITKPAMIRTTCLTKVSPTQASEAHLKEQIEFINSHFAAKVKVSGNIDLNTYKAVGAERFAVSLQQAQAIVREASIVKPVAAA